MGLLYKVRVFDTSGTDPVFMGDGYLGIAIGSTEPVSYSNIRYDYNAFTDLLANTGEQIYLGQTLFNKNFGGPISQKPSSWFPRSNLLEAGTDHHGYQYIRYVFENGSYIEGYGGYSVGVFDANEGVWRQWYDGQPMSKPFQYSFWTDFGLRTNTLVLGGLENGQIPLNADAAVYHIETTGQYYEANCSGAVHKVTLPDYLIRVLNEAPQAQPDPYAPGGVAEPGGGDGTFDWESDIVPVQPLPAISITDAGFVNLYVPTKAQLQNLCRYLWSSAFDIDSLKRIFLEPMDVIIGLSILPITPEEVDADLGTILVGQYSSGISSYVAHKQYVQVDCGTVTIEPKWGAYLDFSPYSKLQLYLPYIGFVDITPDDCMNGTIRVVYNLDILSGACLAQIECTTPGKDGELNSHVLYEYTGNCSVECPITSGQYRNIISSMFNIASGVVETTATGNPTPILSSVIDTVKGITKPTVSRAGGPGKNTGILGHQAPFLVLTCPRMIIPGQQNAMIGYPSYVTLNLGDLNGYTQIDTIHLAGVPASKDEQDEIVDLLQKGVFL